jgi:hypothetical protein
MAKQMMVPDALVEESNRLENWVERQRRRRLEKDLEKDLAVLLWVEVLMAGHLDYLALAE